MSFRRNLISVLLGASLIVGLALAGEVPRPASALFAAHADSPVQWSPWGEVAFARAKAENKPLYVVVGTFTSELGRAMQKQSFGNADIAAQLNASFVCVMVDRDEHALVAASLAHYVQATKQVVGWPLNVWLTPELKPFEGATYLPPSEEWGREGITNVIKRVSAAWSADPAEVRARAEQVLADLAAAADEALPVATLSPAKVDAAFASRRSAADPATGAAGEPPRWLEPELWMAQLARGGADRELALATLRTLLASPVRDPLDGGFFRGASDAAWARPVWVKTTADQARMALVLLSAGDEPGFRDAARAALRFAVSQLRTPEGEFVTSVDALEESQAVAMTWTETEVTGAAGAEEIATLLTDLGVTATGNIPEADDAGGKLRGRNLLSLAPAKTARWTGALKQLDAIRAERTRFARDTNRRAGVNALMSGALTRAAALLDDAELRAAGERLASRLQVWASPGASASRIHGSNATVGADDLAAMAWAMGVWAKDSKLDSKSSASRLWTALAESCLDAKAGRLLVNGKALSEGWRPAPVLPSIAGDLPGLEWFIGASGDLVPGAVREIAARRCAVALDDLGGAPPADVLASALLLR